MPVHTLLVLAGTFFAGATSGATGLAFPLIAAPIFLDTYPPPEAVGLISACSLTGQLFSMTLLRRSIPYEFRHSLIVPGLIGVALGSLLLKHSNPIAIRLVLGALIVLAGVWGLLWAARRARPRNNRKREALVGLVGGLTGGLVGASSVIPAIWWAWQGLSKEDQRAITQPFIVTMQLTSLLSLGCWGELDWSLPADYALVLLPLLAGVAVGVACFRVVSSALVTRVVLYIVTVSGLALLAA